MDGNFMISKIAPSKEPIIRVGIILPADNIKNIELVLSESDSFEIETNEKIYPSCKNNSNITISLNDEKMRINELGVITKKKITPITRGETIAPRNKPNLNHILFNGVKISEFLIPRIRNIIDTIIDQILI